MATEVITFTDLSYAAQSSHPILQWYTRYTRTMATDFLTMDPELFYSSKCKMIMPDASLIIGAKDMFVYLRRIYGTPFKVERVMKRVTLFPQQSDGTYELHFELVTSIFAREGDEGVPIPQSFVYVIGKSEEGKGTGGWQFVGLRNYYDRGVLERVLAAIGTSDQ